MAEKVKMLIPEEEVNARIEELGKKISEEYAGKQVHLICVLKGGVFFMCELAKRITVPVTMDFMSVSSYGDGTQSSGIVKIAKDLDESLEGKDVIVVEDIVDSGRTLYYLLDILRKRGPKHSCMGFLFSHTVSLQILHQLLPLPHGSRDSHVPQASQIRSFFVALPVSEKGIQNLPLRKDQRQLYLLFQASSTA